MAGHEHVPPGGAPVAPTPGWYPDPGTPGQVRFWDGQSWTGQVAPAPRPAGSPPGSTPAPVGGVHQHVQGSSFGCVFYAGGVLVLLAVILVALVLAMRYGPSDKGGGAAAVGACRYFVTERLHNPASAELSDVDAIAPVSGEQWTVTGAVRSETTLGRLRRTDFTCTVEPVSGGWRLVALRFPGR